MNRAMFSGVAGMKTHQTKLDVIGNNIANVNTYGYKSQRAVFSDIYYQTLRGASSGTASRGGQNPSMVGYGSNLLGVQSQMTQSSMQNTGFGLDVAITGEGYLQVQDPDGNIFYTKAGMLDYDANGYLTDINGNFVLGTSPDGKPGTQKIKLDNVGSVNAAKPTVTTDINNKQFTLSASNATAKGNLNFTFASGTLPIGQKAQAVISNSSVNIVFNSTEKFKSMTEIQAAINDAVKEANNGKELETGTFTLIGVPEPTFPGDGLTGAQLVNANFAIDKGTIPMTDDTFFGGFSVKSVGDAFSANGPVQFKIDRINPGANNEEFEITATSGGITYKGKVSKDQMGAPGELLLKNGDSTTDYIKIGYPQYNQMITTAKTYAWAAVNVATFNQVDFNKAGELGGLQITTLGSLADGSTNVKIEFGPSTTAGEYTLKITGTEAGTTYVYEKTDIKQGDASRSISIPDSAGGAAMQVTLPSWNNLMAASSTTNWDPVNSNGNAVPSAPSQDLGLSQGQFTLAGGTEGGPVTLDQLSSISIGADGTVSVHHAEKGTVVAGRISLANFANPSGLQQEGNNYYSASANSGKALLTDPGTDGTGALKSSSLEMSNVDLSQEFADMITTQRGFQANSRVITVSDTMLEELINLKR